MCVVSMIMDHYKDKWGPLTPLNPAPSNPFPSGNDIQNLLRRREPAITDEEIREFRRLLERAREYDKRNNEPDCEMQSKKDAIKAIAKQLGVDVSFVDEQEPAPK